MRFTLLRLFVALLTFTIGTAVVFFESTTCRPQEKAPSSQGHESLAGSTENFRSIGGGVLDGSDGTVIFEKYRASDGSQVRSSRRSYRSPALATRGLRELIRNAERILERTPLINENGEQIGERMVVLWRSDIKWARASVLRVQGNNLFRIEGDVLERVLEFEQQESGR